jgi:hypothetical protein
MLQIIAIVLVVLLVVGFGLVWLYVSRAQRQTAIQVLEDLDGEVKLMADKAHCYGLESRDHTYLTTFGCLAATDDQLVYVQWSPKQQLEIDRSSIVKVEKTKEHKEQEQGSELLSVTFQAPDVDGGRDVVAWEVDDVDDWVGELTTSP